MASTPGLLIESDSNNILNSDNQKMDVKEESTGALNQVKCEYQEANNFHSETVFVSSHFIEESISDSEMCNKIKIKEEPCWTEDKQEMNLSSAADVDAKDIKETTAHTEVIAGNVLDEEALRFHKESICRNNDIASFVLMGTNSEENNNPNVTDASQVLISSRSQMFKKPATLDSNIIQKFKTTYECEITQVKKRLHKCEICNKSFTRPTMLRDHKFIIHEGKRPYTCNICQKGFTQTSHLNVHKLIHDGTKPHTCEICKKSFNRLSTLKQHKVTHAGEIKHTCEICKESFTKIAELKKHNLIHEGKKPPTCEICEKSFAKLSNLKQHKLIHKGLRPYICDICNKSFTQISHLNKHKLLHGGIRPHTCLICKKSFTKLSNMKKHNLTHGLKCEICNKSFSHIPALIEHTLTHKSKVVTITF